MCSRHKKYLQALCHKGLIEHKNFVLTLCSMVSFFVLTKQTFSDFVLNTLYFVLNTLYFVLNILYFVLNFPFLYSMKFNKSLFFKYLYKFKYFEYNEYNKKQIYFKFIFLFGQKLYIKKHFIQYCTKCLLNVLRYYSPSSSRW